MYMYGCSCTASSSREKDTREMAQEFRIVLLLILACLLVIKGHISVPEIEGIEATVIEIPPGGLPLSLLRNKREDFDNASHVGVTARLSNDNHNVAVVHWSGYPSEVIFVLTKQTSGGLYGETKESFLWRSTDYGRTFINETDKFPSDAVAHWYHISKDSNKTIFRDIVNSRLYVTTDEGDTYEAYQMDFQPRNIIYFSYSDLSNPDYVFIMDTSTTKAMLYVSINLGMNWTLIGSGVGAAYWTYLKSGENRSFDDPSTIYFTTLENTGGYRLMRARYPYQNNSDNIQEFDSNLGDIAHFAAHYEYLFAVKNDASASSLFVSYNRQPFAQARFPLSLEQRHYAVVDASEGEVFLAVYHNENFTNLYISDEKGIYYSLTLEDVITNGELYWNSGDEKFDVHVVKGIKGTYIANVEVEGGLYGASVISFDKGAEWVPLTAPTLDQNGVPLNCFPPNCSLHLHMESSADFGISDILSKKTAVGLIMAQGNTGSSLHRSSYYDTKLYFSHDGGFSWQELFPHNHVFQFLDHGSIVVAVRLYARTRVVMFSCDEGVTWYTYNIFEDDNPDEPNHIYTVGMFTELGEKVVHATVFGLEKFPFKEWLLVDLDFSLLNISVCNESQYTTWVPTDERLGRRCLLGERIVYEKRVSGECCINGPDYEIPIGRSTCECAIEDFECDFNFERISIDAPCIPVRGYDPYAVPSNCPEGTNYNVSSGYRRIAGDKCTIDVTAKDNYFLPSIIPCPVRAPEGLYIIQDAKVFGANQPMQFELVQVTGGKLHTHYTWSWGDLTQNITVTGFDDNKHQTHNYSFPGSYTITVSATNDGGSASVTKDVIVLDFIETVIMNGPLMGAVHTELSYSIEVSSKFGTNYTGPITYLWNFKDGTTSTGAAISHTYRDAKNYAISYGANNPVGSKGNITIVLIEEILQDVEMIIEPKISAVNQSVAFSVTMKKSDFYGNISYGYEFGDNSSPSKATTVSHAYSTPGNYLARASLQNLAGVVSVTENVYIQDKISNVTIPSLDDNSSLHVVAIVNREIVFRAIIASVAGTNYYTPVFYHWDFGDGNTDMSADPSITHSYSDPGSWNVTLMAKNNVSSVTFIGRIKVYKAVSHVSINGTNIVSVGSNVTFSINLLRKDEVLPSETVYTWSVSSHIAGTNNISGTNLAQYSRVFSTAGTYEVAVLGMYSSGSFTASFTIIVRSKISGIDIVVDPVIEVNREAMLFVHLSDANKAVYSGSLNITFVLSNNNSDVSYFESAPHKISHHLLYQYSGTYTVQVIAENEVSILNKSISIEVVSTNVSVIISFNASTLKSADINYRDSIWIDQFIALVDNQITNELQLPQWQLVGMVIGIRDDNYDENYFRIQLDILPATLQVQDLGKATDIANQLIQHVSSKGYYLLSPHNKNLTIFDAKIKVQKVVIVVEPSTIFVYNETESLTSSSSKKLAIELGVAGGIALLIAIVLCIGGITYYRRKYHHLEVQYSRLRQSDVVHFEVMEDTTCGEPSSPTKTDVDSVDQGNDEF